MALLIVAKNYTEKVVPDLRNHYNSCQHTRHAYDFG